MGGVKTAQRQKVDDKKIYILRGIKEIKGTISRGRVENTITKRLRRKKNPRKLKKMQL